MTEFTWWQLRTEVTGRENLIVRLPFGWKIHKFLYPNHPDHNGGDY